MKVDEEDRRLGVIRGLLAKAEATEFPDEAEAFFAKASELVARYAIDEATIWAGAERSGRESPDELRMQIHAPYIVQKSVLVGAVARAHGCQTIRLGHTSGGSAETVCVVGFPSDLRWVETLVTSLMVQLTAAMLAAAPRGLTASASAGWRRSFIVGFASEVSDRLTADRRDAVSATASATTAGGAPTVAVVLASRAEEVRHDFRQRFPNVRSSWASAGRSRAGERAGRAAGRDASLSRDRLSGRRALGSG